MADIRIKDLATTATTTASDDFMAVDGVTNGTRKLSAATPAFLTSVTTPSLTSPASTPLTLGTGTSGAAITVLSADNNVGIGTTSPLALLNVHSTLTGNSQLALFNKTSAGSTGSTYLTVSNNNRATDLEQNSGGGSFRYGTFVDTNLVNTYVASGGAFGNINFVTGNVGGSSIAMTIGGGTNKGNVGIGTAAPSVKLEVAGVIKTTDTTAGSSGAGALVVAGGLATGAASYFGGEVTIGSTTGSVGALTINSRDDVSGASLYLRQGNTANEYGFKFYQDTDINGNLTIKTVNNPTEADLLTLNRSTGAATFGGAVTVSGNLVIGTAGNGIDFSATSSGSGTMTSELLNDYEEGTWVPTVGGNATYTATQKASYTKIGRLVTVSFAMEIILIGTGSTTSISGLPFVVGSATSPKFEQGFGAHGYFQLLAVNVYSLTFYAAPNTSQINSMSTNVLGTYANVDPAIYGDGTFVQGTVTYMAA